MELKKKEEFNKMIHDVQEKMYRVAFYILEHEEDAKDAVSEAISTAYEKMSMLKNEKNFETWIITIVANEARDIRKYRQKVILRGVEGYVPDKGKWDSYREWDDIIEQIPAPYKLVLKLRYCEDYKISEISEILNIPKGTVKSRLSRAEKFLKKEFQGESKKKRKENRYDR